MHVSFLTLLALSARSVFAFPGHLSEAMIQIRTANEAKARSGGISAGPECPFAKRQFAGATPPFDAQQQYVSNQGEHAFHPPSGNDQRGPCKLRVTQGGL